MFKPSSNFLSDRSKVMLLLWILFSFVFRVCLCHTVFVLLAVTCWKLTDFLDLLCVMFFLCFVTFPFGVLGQMWHLIVSVSSLLRNVNMQCIITEEQSIKKITYTMKCGVVWAVTTEGERQFQYRIIRKKKNIQGITLWLVSTVLDTVLSYSGNLKLLLVLLMLSYSQRVTFGHI